MRIRSLGDLPLRFPAAVSWWRTSRDAVERLVRMVPRAEWKRLGGLAIALTLAMVAAEIGSALGTTDAAAFVLAGAAVAFATSAAGFSAGLLATLAALLAARLKWDVDGWSALLFLIEGLLITLVVVRKAAIATERQGMLDAAWQRLAELSAAERRSRTIDIASSRLEHVVPEHAVVILDERGAITEWRDGARRLYGCDARDVIGMSAAGLLFPDGPPDRFRRLLDEARRSGVARHAGRHQRAGGDPFDADVEIQPVRERGCQGFTLLVHDRTRDQQSQAWATEARDLQTALRREADVAHRQLATLQSVTDPSLNELPAATSMIALLDRLREAIDADGAAFVRLGVSRRHVLAASAGLRPQRGTDRPAADVRAALDTRILFVHNDPSRVAEVSLAGWPDEVTSLIAVPVLYAGRSEGRIEVVGVRGRRSTEWEIALIEVVAARAAGLAHDDTYANAVA